MDCSEPLFNVVSEQNGKTLILPSGYWFRPHDAELVVHFLKKKILDQQLPTDVIPTIDVYSYGTPNQLPFGQFKSRKNNVWYFFTTRPKGDLLTSDGYWRALSDGEIFDRGQVVGFMQTLAFCFAKPQQGMKIEWYIDEYRVRPEIFAAAELDDSTKEKVVFIHAQHKKY